MLCVYEIGRKGRRPLRVMGERQGDAIRVRALWVRGEWAEMRPWLLRIRPGDDVRVCDDLV